MLTASARTLERKTENEKEYEKLAKICVQIIDDKLKEAHSNGLYNLEYTLPAVFDTKSNEILTTIQKEVYARVVAYFLNQGFHVYLLPPESKSQNHILMLGWLSQEKRDQIKKRDKLLEKVSVVKSKINDIKNIDSIPVIPPEFKELIDTFNIN